MKTAQEILDSKLDSLDYNINRELLTNAMEEYADQYIIELPTDEEIKSMRLDMDFPVGNEEEHITNGFRAGVMWLRNRILKKMDLHAEPARTTTKEQSIIANVSVSVLCNLIGRCRHSVQKMGYVRFRTNVNIKLNANG